MIQAPAALAPRTEAGRQLLALWLSGRTHPPSAERLREFTRLILATENEASAGLNRLRELLADWIAPWKGDTELSVHEFGAEKVALILLSRAILAWTDPA